MRSKRRVLLTVVSFTLLILMLNLAIPGVHFATRVHAQEATEEPTVPPTPTDMPTATPTVIPTEVPPVEPTVAPTGVPPVEPTVAPPVEITEEPTAPPAETTEEPANPETTVEPVPATEEPTASPTNEPTPQPQPTVAPVVSLFMDDFQDGDTAGWLLTPGWVVATEETNLFLAGATNETATVLDLAWENMAVTARLRVEVGDSVNVAVKAAAENYTVTLDGSGQVTLSRGGVVLATGPAPAPLPDGETPPPAVWRTLNIQVLGSTVSVTLDGVLQVSFTDETPLAAGTVAFMTGADNVNSVALDDVTVQLLEAPQPTPEPEATEVVVLPEMTDEAPLPDPEATEDPVMLPEATEEPTETPAPVVLSEENRRKLGGALGSMTELYLNGDEAGSQALAAAYFLKTDDAGRISVVLWAAADYDGLSIVPLVEAVGGEVTFVNDRNVEAHVPLAGFVALVNTVEIETILPVNVATSTSSNFAPSGGAVYAPAGSVVTEGFDIIGANDWHTAGFTGGGVRIAVIDTGFVGIGSVAAAERACLSSTTPVGGAGTGNHGVNVVEVLCDIAPGATVTMYQADTASLLASRISSAVSGSNKIILITLDLGASAGPGDGTGGSEIDAVYTQITNARNAGRLVVVSAGNNRGRYRSFQYTNGGTTNITITANAGDRVNVSWDDWGASPAGDDLTLNLSDGGAINLNNTVRPIGGAPSYQFTVPTLGSCAAAPAALCTLTLQISATSGGSNYVQVQATGVGQVTGPTGSGFSNVNTTASLGRPADSQDALTVGAVCAANDSTSGAFPLIAASSRGPVFGAGGTAPGASGGNMARNSVKPDLMGPSEVSTTLLPLNLPGDCNADDGDGFGGTSAAAAHVAGMAALLVSSNNANLSAFDAGNAAAVNELQDYLQTHAIDLPFHNPGPPEVFPNGFDTTYGAGLTVLGNPAINFNWQTFTDPVEPATCSGSILYVSTANPDSTQNGTLSNPYIHPANALAHAGANNCVVLLPGEYVTPLEIDNSIASGVILQSYDSAVASDAAISRFWVNDGFESGGGIEVAARSNPFTLQGFIFNSAAPLDIGGPLAVNPLAVQVTGSSAAVITSNTFTSFQEINHASVPVVIANSQNITVDGNLFSENDVLRGAALKIQNSGSSTPILVQNNDFNNNHTSIAGTLVSDPVLRIEESQVDVYDNRFVENDTKSLVHITNSNDAYEVSFFSNLFMNNLNTGPVIHLDPNRRFRFINNTVVGHSLMTNLQYGAIIARGNPGNPGVNGDGVWDIYNNLFYDNSALLGPVQDLAINSTCGSIEGGSDNGVRNNWASNSGDTGGDCSISWLGYNNILDTDPLPLSDPNTQFVGATIAPNDPYRLKGTSTGIDAGDDALVTVAGINLATATDVLGNARYEDGNGDTTIHIDIGAYEFISVKGGAVVANLNEDDPSGSIAFIATGGFPPYTYTITSLPPFYDTDAGNACGGQPYQHTTPSTDFLTYCPPKNFYNTGYAAGAITFNYQVSDQVGGTPGTGTITINVAPTDDPAQVDPVIHTIRVEENQTANTTINFRMRPYVRFDDNFFFSEDDNTTLTPGADYPYTYSYVGGSATGDLGIIVGGEGAISAAVTAANGTNGLVTLTALQDQTGTVTFHYRTTDADGEPTPSVDNIVTIEIVPSLPDSGIHDDTSFAFDYTGAGWMPIYSEGNINNTLHQTRVVNEQADFRFVGTGFAAYMQGHRAGGYWELQVDDHTITWNGQQVVTQNGMTCRTTAVTGTTANAHPDQIYGRTTLPYVVSCTRLRADEAHTVSFINRGASYLQVDAVGILIGDNALYPGFHEVSESQMTQLFFGGWTRISDRFASGQVAMEATSASVPDIQFSFQGSGIEVGTVLERFYDSATRTYSGTSYDICVTPAGGAGEVCQRFDNSIGTPPPSRPIYNVFRPIVGLDPALEHTARIHINSVPANGRLVIDSITVLDDEPLGILPLGSTEDDVFGMIVTGNGVDDSWQLDTNNRRTSNNSLTSVARRIPYAGPFITFQIPANADTINWFRYAGRSDSQDMVICVDRGLGVAGGGYGNCIIANLRTGEYSRVNADGSTTAGGSTISTDPLMISESLFREAWTGVASHTVEIFSLTNQPFNLDKIQVVGSTLPFLKGYYEQDVPGIQTFDNTLTLGTGSFTTVTSSRYSGKSVMQTTAIGDGVLFQFNGTGFAVNFTLFNKSDQVNICVTDNLTTDVNAVLTTGICRIFNNESRATVYQAARSLLGLTPGDHTVAVQMLDNPAHNTRYLPITMQLDAVQVFNTWDTLNPLDTTGVRYETSYTNQSSDNLFLYYGNGWRSVSGRAARLYSGENYDLIQGVVGAGIAFRTDNADTVRLIRSTSRSNAPLLVCTAPHDGAFNVDMNQYTCVTVRNDGGTANQQIFNIPLSGAGPHVVSITTLTNGRLYLDAIELANSAALTPGLYPDTDPGLLYAPLDDETNAWRNLPLNRRYSDNAAMETTAPGASLTFDCLDCTGFSLFTLADRYSGLLDVTVSGTTNGGATLNITKTLTAYSTATLYSSALNLADLPIGDYTFTITENDPTTDKFVVDGVLIYGAYDTAMAPGLYDDAAVDAAGTPYMTFGPRSTDWTFNTGSRARTNMEQTVHYTRNLGGQLRFSITGADTITLFHTASRSTMVEVCATRLTANPVTNGNRNCTTIDFYANGYSTTLGSEIFPAGVGSYAVTVTNLNYPNFLYIDSVGVYDSTANLGEGIYQDSHALLSGKFHGTWTPNTLEAAATDRYVNSTGTGDTGDYLEFTFDGVGFSIVLVESTVTSGNYTLKVDGVDTVIAPTPSSSTKKPVAITRVGLTNGTHTIRLTNNDSTKPLLVDRVDILEQPSATQDIDDNTVGNIENTDDRIFYFPFGSLTQLDNRLASGGSQHTGTMQGSVVFFELNNFTGSAVQYVRQTSTSYGTVNVCYGSYGGAATCTPVANNLANAYQAAATISVACGGETWVSIENTDGKTMPLDYIRPFDANDPLTAGYYEDTFAGLSSIFNFDGSFTEVADTRASGGTVQSTTTADATALFQFNGTGFSVLFTLNQFADTVKICWVDSATLTPATVLAGTCQTFNNESSRVTYQAARTILGLNSGVHTAVVQIQSDPAHDVRYLPISMQVDAVQVYNDALPVNVLDTTGINYETSYDNRVADGLFNYYGSAWRSFTGRSARNQSGENYDQTRNVVGAGVVFQTNNANNVTLYRDTRRGYASIEACAIRVSDQARQCFTIDNGAGTGYQQPVAISLFDTTPHIVTLTTLDTGIFNLDAVKLVDTTAALPAGFYEDTHPGLNYSGSDWTTISSRSYTDSHAAETLAGTTLTGGNPAAADGSMIFRFTGTGFEIGTQQDRFGGEVQICYRAGSYTDPMQITAANGATCHLYQNETARTSYTVSYLIGGLTSGTYSVRVQNVDDGLTQLTVPATTRNVRYPVKLRVDYVQVFDTLPPTLNTAGLYNENAVDGSGDAFLQPLPANRWGTISGRAARTYSNESYMTIVDDRGRLSRIYAGPAVALRVNVPAEGATVILYTEPRFSRSFSNQLLVCADGGTYDTLDPLNNDNCAVFDSLTNAAQLVLTSTDLAALGSAGVHTLTFRTLTPSGFTVDGFQVIQGSLLAPGVYDDFMASAGGVLDTSGTWTTLKSSRAYGGTYIQSNILNDHLTFQFDGTGFAVITQVDRRGADMNICYALTATFDGNFYDGNTTGETCQVFSTDTYPTYWTALNGNTPLPGTAYQFGFDIYGLPADLYTAEVRLIDDVQTPVYTTADYLKIDAIAVFGDVSEGGAATPLTPGQLYDDVDAMAVDYALGHNWTANSNFRYGPSRGPWNLTEHTGKNAGTVMQVYLQGNALVLYQTGNSTSSSNVRVCLATNEGPECNEFSQMTRRTYFTPVVFYGFGDGNHTLIFENRDYRRSLSVDAMQVLP
ncbi:MAG: S8 family serine peptidase [Anaerolineaceae bacterium]|nr:S8 family serine peptidase [Anaerolineaceae bacterium]